MTATLNHWYFTHPHERLTRDQAHQYLAEHGHSDAAIDHFIHTRTLGGFPLTPESLKCYANSHSLLTAVITRREVEEWIGDAVRLDVIQQLGWEWLVTDGFDSLRRFGHATAHGIGTTSGRLEWLIAYPTGGRAVQPYTAIAEELNAAVLPADWDRGEQAEGGNAVYASRFWDDTEVRVFANTAQLGWSWTGWQAGKLLCTGTSRTAVEAVLCADDAWSELIMHSRSRIAYQSRSH